MDREDFGEIPQRKRRGRSNHGKVTGKRFAFTPQAKKKNVWGKIKRIEGRNGVREMGRSQSFGIDKKRWGKARRGRINRKRDEK